MLNEICQRQTLYNTTYMWHLKKYHTLLNKTKKKNNQTHRYRKEIGDYQREGGRNPVGKKEKDLSNGILKVIQL